MPAITDHDDLVEALLGKFHVFLLNRYEDDRLGFNDMKIRVFLPDLHWISKEDQNRFPSYHFNGNEMLPLLFDVLEDAVSLAVFQTGDRLDFWRASVPKHASPEETYDAILSDSQVKGLHDRLRAFTPTQLRGNHDRWVEEIAAESPCPETTPDATGRIFLTHGHIWDQIEKLPDDWKRWAVSIAKNVQGRDMDVGPLIPGTVELIRQKLRIRRDHPELAMPLTVKTVGGVEVTTAADVYDVERAFLPIDQLQIASLTSAFDDFHDTAGIVTFGGDVRERAATEAPDCRLFIIAHTHHARMLVDRHPRGGPLVTMDCGAWIENCTIAGDSPIPSAQFGVQFGNDLRIYQLAPL